MVQFMQLLMQLFVLHFFLDHFLVGHLYVMSGFQRMNYFLNKKKFFKLRMMYVIAAINFCYAPLMFFLRYLPPITTEVQQQQVQDGQEENLNTPLNKKIIINKPLIYEKVEGINDPQLLYGNEQQQRNCFDSVWDD
jgi:hypothetical protein